MAPSIHLVHCIRRYEVTNYGIGHTEAAALADFRRQFSETYLHRDQPEADRLETIGLMEEIVAELSSSGGYASDADGNYVFHIQSVALPAAE